MRVVNIIESLDASYGGPAVSLPMFINSIVKLGVDSEIWTISSSEEINNEYVTEYSIKVKAFEKVIFKYFSFHMTWCVLKTIIRREVDIFHFHSVWSSPTWVGMLLCRVFSVPYVLSPRSSLYSKSLQRRKFLKGVVSELFLKRLISSSAFVHCTDEAEKVDVLKYCECRTFVLSHGVPRMSEISEDLSYHNFILEPLLGKRNLLYCSRIHPRKNLHIAIDAFSKSGLAKRGWKFIVAGPIDDHEYMRKIINNVTSLDLVSDIIFTGIVLEPQKSMLFKRCDVFVLLSEFENFGMSISEALINNTFVLISPNTPWKEIENFGVGVISEIDQVSAAKGLLKLSDLVDKTTDLSRFLDYVENKCISWDEVACRFKCEYRNIGFES